MGAAAAEQDLNNKHKPSAKAYAQLPIPPPSRVLFTVDRLAEQQPGLTKGKIRWDLFNRKSNGLEESGAVVNRGRRLLLDQDRYLDWLARGQKGVA